MVDTIKFSQMTDGGNLANDDKTPGLQSGTNVLFNNPWTFLPPGTTAQRPTPSSTVNFRLRFNTEDQLYEYYDSVLGAWTQLQESAFTQGPFITYTASTSLPDAQNLGALANGILTQTISAGIATLDILPIPLTGANGGTGIDNGLSTITIGGNVEFSGAFSFTGIITGDTNVTFPTSGTLATTTSSSGHVSSGTINQLTWYAATGDTVSGLSTANGGTLITDNTGVPSILAGSGVTGNYLQSVSGASPVWSTITWPTGLTTYQLLYCGSTNVVNALNPANSAVLCSTETGAPNWVGPLTDGQIIIGSTGLVPVGATLTQGSGVTITNAPGSITISATGTGGTVTSVATGAGLTGGTITTTGTIALAAIADHTLLANISGGALAPSSTTLTALIDNAIGNTQGNILYRNASSWVVLAPGTSGQVLQTSGAAANPAYSTATYPSVAGSAGKILISDGTNFVSSTPTFPTTAGTIGSIIISDGTNKINSTSLWPNTVGTAGKILRSDGTTNSYTTSTFADTYAMNTLLYNASANTVSELPTANSGVLITSSGGVPSISSTLPSAVQTNITALGTQAQALNMGTHLINNVVDPVNPQDAATRNYVDQTALTGTSVYAASAASLGTVTQSGAGVGATLTNAGTQATFALDGVNPPVGSEVLIKNTATGMSAANEGIYVVTSAGSGASNWILTRDVDYDTPSEINETGLIIVRNGSTLAGTGWYNAATIVTVDTTPFSFSQFGSGGTVTSVATNNGLTGGTITSAGTIGLAAIAAHNLLANVTAGSAVPTAVATSTFLQQVVIQKITGTGTYTPTTGMVYCTVRAVGGGGGGGGAASTAGQSGQGGGGGGGGYCEKTYTAALIGATAAVVIGAAGAAGSSGQNNGGDGGNTTFTPAGAGAILTASGGVHGNGSGGTASSNIVSGGAGGAATNGDLNLPGGNGEQGVVIVGSTGIVTGGSGGGSGLGNGQAVAGNTSAGNLYGGGGTGAAAGGANGAGGAGAIGVVYITEYIAI